MSHFFYERHFTEWKNHVGASECVCVLFAFENVKKYFLIDNFSWNCSFHSVTRHQTLLVQQKFIGRGAKRCKKKKKVLKQLRSLALNICRGIECWVSRVVTQFFGRFQYCQEEEEIPISIERKWMSSVDWKERKCLCEKCGDEGKV